MEKPRNITRWRVELPLVPDYRPLGESGSLAGDLYGPATLRVLADVDDAQLGTVELDMALIEGRYRITKLTATAHDGSWVDVESVRRLDFSGLIVAALKDRVELRFRTGEGTYTTEPAANLDDPLWYPAMYYTISRAMGGDPTRELAEELVITRAAAAQKVKRLRAKGYLPATTQGRAR